MPHIDTLTQTLLRQLYVEDGKTETEIATMFGVYQVKIGRLRRKFGIPTVSKSSRLGLPDVVSSRLRSILIGSMLGDGGLSSTGGQTARYSEHHCAQQKLYLDWKASEWGPFLIGITPSDKGEYQGFRLSTHGCIALRPYWERFYPDGAGAKTFIRMPLKWVDPLALAVWYMDDGSKNGRYVRFHVSPNPLDREVQLRIFRKFHIEVKDYEEKNGNTLFIHNRTGVNRFLELVRPHIHPSLAYKLEVDLSKAGPAPIDLLTSDRVQPLLDRGLSVQAIATFCQVSRGSVQRALNRMGVDHRPLGRPVRSARKELPSDAARLSIEGLDSKSPTYVDDVVAVLAMTELPVPPITLEEARQDADRLRRAPTKLEGDQVLAISWAGSKLCQKYFPHRLDAGYRNNLSVREAWYDPKHLRQAVLFQIRVGDPLIPTRVFRALQAVPLSSCRECRPSPTNFRPCIAKAIVEAFCPEGGIVLDPCAGYGGRAAGTMAANRIYVGVDPHPKAENGVMGVQNEMGGKAQFFNAPFEDVSLGLLQADLVFTSPPYFSVEKYANDTTQSWVRYPSWEQWLEGFLRPFVEKSFAHLKTGGMFCINTKNIRMGRAYYPIGDELIKAANTVGFSLDRTLELPIGRIGKNPKSEPLFVFIKPN